jgi:hypothetical protein
MSDNNSHIIANGSEPPMKKIAPERLPEFDWATNNYELTWKLVEQLRKEEHRKVVFPETEVPRVRVRLILYKCCRGSDGFRSCSLIADLDLNQVRILNQCCANVTVTFVFTARPNPHIRSPSVSAWVACVPRDNPD